MISSLFYKFRVKYRGGINGDLIGTGIQHGAHILNLANTATDGQGNKYLAGHVFHHVHHGLAIIGTGRDIEKSNFIGPLLIIAARDFHRVTGIADIDELHALDHAALVHVETGNDAFCQAHAQLHSISVRKLIRQLLRCGKIQRALVNGATGYGGRHPF